MDARTSPTRPRPARETLRTLRTKLGIVTHRATIDGKPYAYTKLRATYFHEADSALGFSEFNNPDAIRSPQDFQRAAQPIDYTFNWFYADGEHIAYFNSGENPVRARHVDPNFPTLGTPRFEWRGFEPGRRSTRQPRRRSASTRRSIDQNYLTSWNNKQARGYRAADDNFGYQSLYRVKPLDDRIKARDHGQPEDEPGRADRRDGGRRHGRPARRRRPAVGAEGDQQKQGRRRRAARRDRDAQAWRRSGAHRRDRDGNGVYEHAEAMRIMDAWWPLLLEAAVQADARRRRCSSAIQTVIGFDDAPRAQGSAYQDGLVRVRRRRTCAACSASGSRARYSREYCGGGKLRQVPQRAAGLAASRRSRSPARELYGTESCDGGDPQWCNDAVRFRALGAVTQPPIHWINRPTFQQVIEIKGPASRASKLGRAMAWVETRLA